MGRSLFSTDEEQVQQEGTKRSGRRTDYGVLTTSTITIIIITTYTCCSREMLLPVKQEDCMSTMCSFVCVSGWVAASVCMCICTSCRLHNSLPVLDHTLALTVHSSSFTSPLCLPPPPFLTVSLHIFMDFLFIMETYA